MTVLIVDDEKSARDLLQTYVTAYPGYDFVIATAHNLDTAVAAIVASPPDVILLDIQMPGGSGLELFERLGTTSIMSKIIFVTAHSNHAVAAFKMQAIDYILKPVDEDELYRALDRAVQQNELKVEQFDYTELEKALKSLQTNKIMLEVPKGYKFLDPGNILYLEADGMYTTIKVLQGSDIVISKPLKVFEQQLAPHLMFFRPQRSFIINLNHITEIKRQTALYIVMQDGKGIPVNRERKNTLLEKIRQVF